MRYRYITCGRCSPTEQISSFRIISNVILGRLRKPVGSVIYRVHIPDDLKLEKYDCDEYATTHDPRTLEQLGCDIMMVMWNGKKKILPPNTDIDEIAKQQYQKWSKSLYENPETAYHMYRPGESWETVHKKGTT